MCAVQVMLRPNMRQNIVCGDPVQVMFNKCLRNEPIGVRDAEELHWLAFPVNVHFAVE